VERIDANVRLVLELGRLPASRASCSHSVSNSSAGRARVSLNTSSARARREAVSAHAEPGSASRGPSRRPLGRRSSIESFRLVLNPLRPQRRWATALSAFLHEPSSGRAAACFAQVWPPLVLLSVLCSIVAGVHGAGEVWPNVAAAAVETAFLIEAALRLAASPTALGFLRGLGNMIDLAAAMPLAVRAAFGLSRDGIAQEGFAGLFLLCAVPVLRLLKLFRWMRQLHLFRRVLDDTREVMCALFLILAAIILSFASLVYVVEPRSHVGSYTEALWTTVVAITTVGVAQPTTDVGHVVLSALLLVSVLFMSMPIGILGNAFTQVWKDRDLILLSITTRDSLAQAGYAVKDIEVVFRIFDNHSKGELSIEEFQAMIAELRVDLPEDRLVEVFDLMDKDGDGNIHHKEFLHLLFPRTYYDLYGSKGGPPPGRLPSTA